MLNSLSRLDQNVNSFTVTSRDVISLQPCESNFSSYFPSDTGKCQEKHVIA